jgi:hypothetical protein
MKDKLKMIEIASKFMKSVDCIMTGDFINVKKYDEAGMKLLEENFPELITDEKFVNYIKNRPYDYYATLTNTIPIYPWLGMSSRGLWGAYLGVKE